MEHADEGAVGYCHRDRSQADCRIVVVAENRDYHNRRTTRNFGEGLYSRGGSSTFSRCNEQNSRRCSYPAFYRLKYIPSAKVIAPCCRSNESGCSNPWTLGR